MAKLSNLNISSYNAQYVYNRLVELAHEGVVYIIHQDIRKMISKRLSILK